MYSIRDIFQFVIYFAVSSRTLLVCTYSSTFTLSGNMPSNCNRSFVLLVYCVALIRRRAD